MKILFVETENWEQEYLTAQLSGHELVFSGKPELTADGTDAAALCTFLGLPVNAELLEQMPQLKFVATRSTGYDHIDAAACKAKGVAVSNVPTYGENTVAEYAFALLLSLSRKMFASVKQVRERGLFETKTLQGFDLKDKIFGVIGTGHIGAYAVKIAKGFGMKVMAYDPYPNEKLSAEYGFTYGSLEEVLKNADVVSLHVPYMPATHHMLNKENLGLMKPSAVLINTARGGLVETAGLVWALKNNKLAGAGLDVLEEEGFIKEEAELLINGHPNQDQLKIALADHELMQMDNVLITPHNAFNSREAVMRILDTTVENLKAFAAGKPVNLIK
jgi:D-lactate dehydrogenase